MKHVLTTSELNALIDARCTEIVMKHVNSGDTFVSQDKFNQLESRMNEFDKSVQLPFQLPVYFTVHRNSHFNTANQVIPFPIVVTESNSGFDASSGILTVKVPGVYLFVVTLMKYSSSGVNFSLYHNSLSVCQAASTDKSNYQMVTCPATLGLKSGDTVSVKLLSGKIHNGVFSTFTGVKIGNN